jgi:hypothetical protein
MSTHDRFSHQPSAISQGKSESLKKLPPTWEADFSIYFADPASTNLSQRFYHVILP